MIIGVTGKMGSGKTTIANIIKEEYDFEVIHIDEVAHQVLTFDAYVYFLSQFGVTAPGKEIDRKFLGKFLFSSEVVMKKYNAYIYELIKLEITRIRQSNPNGSFIYDWNFLPITSLMDECDLKILMTCPVEERKKRVKKRDNIDGEYFDSREAMGLEYNEEEYDLVIENSNLLEKKDEIKKVLGDYICK